MRTYTPAEAAAVSEIGVKAVHNAIDKKIVETVARPASHGTRMSRRALTGDGLLRLKLWYGVGATLAAERRQRLFDAIKAAPSAKTVKADDLLIIDVAEARRQLTVRVRDLDEAESVVHRAKGLMDGEPVFRGTRITVRSIASMLSQGAEEAEILEGYPKLTPRLLELAKIWAAAHPARGRPRKLAGQGYVLKSSKRTRLEGDLRSSTRKDDASA